MLRRIVCCLVFGMFLMATAGAQTQQPQVRYKKETTYDFDDDVIEGELQRPEGDVITERTQSKHSSLIKVRLHFIPELIKSAENL